MIAVKNQDLHQRLLMEDELEKNQQLDKMIQVQNIIKKYVENEYQQTNGQSVVSSIVDQPAKSGFRIVNAVSIDDDGNELTLCAKDIIL